MCIHMYLCALPELYRLPSPAPAAAASPTAP